MSSSSICSAIGSIPVIDLSSLKQNHHVRDESLVVVDEVRNACLKLGCFKVINHGISKSVINGALEAASDFFALSTEEKKALASEDIHRPVRYGTCLKDERIKPREFLKQYAHPLSKWINFWPLSPPHYREKMGKYAVEVRRVALQLMDVILESLGLDHAYLRDKLDEGMQVMTVNNYVSRERTGSILGMPPHSDYGCITILLQSCEGLEIMDRNDRGWSRVKEFPDALHVHVGDYMEVLSNGRYKSVVHRVVLNCEKRMSIASIHGLAMDEMVTVAKELVDEQHPRGYRESSFRDFLSYITRNDFTSGCRKQKLSPQTTTAKSFSTPNDVSSFSLCFTSTQDTQTFYFTEMNCGTLHFIGDIVVAGELVLGGIPYLLPVDLPPMSQLRGATSYIAPAESNV